MSKIEITEQELHTIVFDLWMDKNIMNPEHLNMVLKDKIKEHQAKHNEDLGDVSCCDFALWLQDNYSTNKKQGYTEPLPKGYWRKDFTDEHYSVTELAELYKKSYS